MAIELDPFYAIAYAKRGEIYEEKGNLKMALRDYNRALEIYWINNDEKNADEMRGIIKELGHNPKY
jgi:tetratricopeptide (TPR) repeat protein